MKKKVKVYLLIGSDYESSFTLGVYSNKQNAEKAQIRREQNRDKYDIDFEYWINEHEIKDLFNEKET